VEYLKKQVADLRKSSELAQLDRADTINRLTHSVEESQRQCQQLLEAGKDKDTSVLCVHTRLFSDLDGPDKSCKHYLYEITKVKFRKRHH